MPIFSTKYHAHSIQDCVKREDSSQLCSGDILDRKYPGLRQVGFRWKKYPAIRLSSLLVCQQFQQQKPKDCNKTYSNQIQGPVASKISLSVHSPSGTDLPHPWYSMKRNDGLIVKINKPSPQVNLKRDVIWREEFSPILQQQEV